MGPGPRQARGRDWGRLLRGGGQGGLRGFEGGVGVGRGRRERPRGEGSVRRSASETQGGAAFGGRGVACPWCVDCVTLKALRTSGRGTLDVILRAVGSHRGCRSTGRTRPLGRADPGRAESGGGAGRRTAGDPQGERPRGDGSGFFSTRLTARLPAELFSSVSCLSLAALVGRTSTAPRALPTPPGNHSARPVPGAVTRFPQAPFHGWGRGGLPLALTPGSPGPEAAEPLRPQRGPRRLQGAHWGLFGETSPWVGVEAPRFIWSQGWGQSCFLGRL